MISGMISGRTMVNLLVRLCASTCNDKSRRVDMASKLFDNDLMVVNRQKKPKPLDAIRLLAVDKVHTSK